MVSQQIDSAVIRAVSLTSFYFKVVFLVYALSHADEET